MANKRKQLHNTKNTPSLAQMVENIAQVYEVSAQREDYQALVSWYDNARAFCAQLAAEHNLTVNQVAAVVAVVSPQLSWEKNKLTARRIIENFFNGAPMTGVIAYPANIAKALRILQGEAPESVVSGPKVTSFYNNILGNASSVTVDRHALHIALYGLAGESEKSGSITPTNKLYAVVADAYKIVADAVNLQPAQVQSVTWSFKAQTAQA